MFGPPFLVLPQKLVVTRRAQNKFARKTSFDVFAAHQSRIQTLLNLVVGTMGFGRPVHVGSPDQLALAVGAHLRLVLVVQCGFLEVPLPSRLEQLNGVDFVTVPPLLCLLRESSSLRLTSCSPSARWCGRHGWLVPLILLPSSLCTGAFGPLRRSSSFRNGLPLPACRCLTSFFGGLRSRLNVLRLWLNLLRPLLWFLLPWGFLPNQWCRTLLTRLGRSGDLGRSGALRKHGHRTN